MNNNLNAVRKTIEEKMASGREFRKTQIIEARESKENGSKIVSGYATTFNETYTLYDFGDYAVEEEIDARAFDECDFSDVIMQYDHSGRVFARTSNKTLRLNIDGHGLHIEADLSGTKLGNDVYEEIRGGYTTKMSFAFKVTGQEKTVIEDEEKNKITVHRKITKISKLYDVSAVSLPANDGTDISARNFVDGVIAEIKAERLRAEERSRKVKILKLMLEVNS